MFLKRLKQHGLVLQQNKCVFMQESVEYLGHIVDAQGLHATPEKQQAIEEARAPDDVNQLRSFLGLLNYYGKFIPNLASIIQTLNALLRKDTK